MTHSQFQASWRSLPLSVIEDRTELRGCFPHMFRVIDMSEIVGADISEMTGNKKSCLNCMVLQNEEDGMGQNLQLFFAFIIFNSLFGGKREIH